MADLNKNKSTTPHLAVTIGDPAGIGTEIILKALADTELSNSCQITVVGSASLLEKTYRELKSIANSPLVSPDKLTILDIPTQANLIKNITLGRGNAASGELSFIYLEQAIALTLAGKFDAIVTAPIAKYLWKEAGYNYPGQTEVLAQKAGIAKYGMLFVARSPHTDWTLRTLLATTHIPLDRVSATLNPQLMSLKLDLLIDSLKTDFGIETPTIAIAGLNPHSGEAGQLGIEERDWLIPWLETQRQNRPQVNLIGPIPPDTMWVKPGQAWYNSSKISSIADAYLALYHDQGLIPVKLMAFDRAINTTIGLPFIRTSPDHGTAFDIAGKGIADASSIREAIQLAAELTKQRHTFSNV
jgi:4-hydroxythreonine-4-phosphate dehydrogenase